MSNLSPQLYKKLGLPFGILISQDISDINNSIESISGSYLKEDNFYNTITESFVNISFGNFVSGTASGFSSQLITGYFYDYKIVGSGRYHVVYPFADQRFFYNTNFGTGVWLSRSPNPADGGSSYNKRIAVSDDLKCMTIIQKFPGFYSQTSLNSGVSFSDFWQNSYLGDVAMSSDGKFQIIALSDGATSSNNVRAKISSNSGISWSINSGVPTGSWELVDVSSDFKVQVIAAENGPIIVSHNSGTSWFTGFIGNDTGLPSGPMTAIWRDLKISKDGKDMIAVENDLGYIFCSNDSGVYWHVQDDFYKPTGQFDGLQYWRSVSLSKVGDNLFQFAVGVKDDLLDESKPKLVYGKYNDQPWILLQNVPSQLTGRIPVFENTSSSINSLKIASSKDTNIVGLVDNSNWKNLPPFVAPFSGLTEILSKFIN
jgi:hypothetical protein